MEIHRWPETIVNWTKYFDLVFLITARHCQLVGLARASLTWLPSAFHLSSDKDYFSFCLSLRFLLLRGEGVLSLTLFCDFIYRSLGPFLIFPIRLTRYHSSGGVGMQGSSFNDIDLEWAVIYASSPVWWAAVLMLSRNKRLLPFCQPGFLTNAAIGGIKNILPTAHCIGSFVKRVDLADIFTLCTKAISWRPCSTISFKTPSTMLLIGVLILPFAHHSLP